MNTSNYHNKFSLCLLALLLTITPFTQFLPRVEANSTLILSAYDTPSPPTIDGDIQTDEWGDADTTTFGPITVGMQSITGTLYMMNNGTTLFMAVEIDGDDDLGSNDYLCFVFDNDNGGETSHETGDDDLILYGHGLIYDAFYTGTGWDEDTNDGGSAEIDGDVGRHSGVNHFELSHPLDTSDDTHDFSLSNDDIVGFYLHLRVDNIACDLSSYGLGSYGNPSTFADYKVAVVTLSAFTFSTPTIDGTLSAGEWSGADNTKFFVRGYSSMIYVMNDLENLYIAVAISDDDSESGDTLRILFDNDNGGETSHELGDDRLFLNTGMVFSDGYWDGTVFAYDTGDGGTYNGYGDGSKDGANKWYFEFYHPLDSTDDSHDFSLSIGDIVGFNVYYYDDDPVGSGPDWWPGGHLSPDTYGDIVITPIPLVGMLNFDDYANRMGSMPGVEPSDTLYFPHFHRDSSWQTFYALVNPGTSSATVDVTYYASDGSTISSETLSLDPGHKTGKFSPTGSGWIKVVSSQPIVGMLNFDDYANRMGSMPGVTPSSTFYFPHFHQDSNWQTFYALVNPQSIAASVNVYYYASDGSLITGELISLDPGHKTGKFPPSGTGWIKVESSQPIVGMLNFDDYRNRMGSMPGVEPSDTLYFPHFDQGSSWQTYGAIVNPNDISASVTMTFYANDGSVIDSMTDIIESGHKSGGFPPTGSGWIKVESSMPVVGMVNFDDYANRMGSMPGIDASSALYFPHFDQGSSWQTYYAIVNLEYDCTFTSTYYASDGSIAGTASISLDEDSKTGRFPVTGSGWIESPSIF